jgi:hypothetical protein
MPERQPDTLMVFIAPRGSVPLPPPFVEAGALFDEARVDYEQHRRFDEAARLFLEAARLLQQVGGFHASTAAANRRGCYRNAWGAFRAAGHVAEGRAALTAAARADPALADAIDEIIGGSAGH